MKFKDAVIVPIEKLIPYEMNAKKHPEEQINALASMFLEYGFDQPIVVDKNYVIVKGHGRRLAAIKAGFKEVPVIVRDDMTAAKVRASRIADNRIAQTDWDAENLLSELRKIEEEDPELLLLTGHAEDELQALMSEVKDPSYEDLEAEEDPDLNTAGVRKAIQIEFSIGDYEEAFLLVKHFRDRGDYVGGMLINFLRSEKEKQ